MARISIFRQVIALTLLVTLGAMCPKAANAESQETPATLIGVTVVGAKTVAKMMKDANVRLIDTRSLHDFLVGHLPNAYHVDYPERSSRIPDFDATPDGTAAFVGRLKKFANSDQSIVLYCNGITCWKSYKAAIALKKDGYRNIYWFRGGIYEWQKDGNPVIVEFDE